MIEPLQIEPLFPDRESGEPLAMQLVRRLRGAIESGSIAPGTKMLGTRQLAKRLGLGRNTVALAFEQLVAEGYLEARHGSGTFVGAGNFERKPRPRVTGLGASVRPHRTAELRARFEVSAGRGPLRPGTPALARFPVTAWKRSARRSLAEWDRELSYETSNGTRALRESIAMHVRQFRGISAMPDQVVVVEGAQAALHLICITLATAGDAIAIEDPCYALARAAFELHGLQLRPVNVDDEGIRTLDLPSDVRLAYVTPTHQFPLGGTLPLVRRLQLLAWAKERGAYIIEDDYDSEFTTRARPLPALQSLDHEERVIYVGTFSKVLAPGLRSGYLIVPPHLASAFRTVRATTSLGLSLELQATLSHFIAEGHFARHIRRMNAFYERNRMLAAHALEPLAKSGFRLGPMQVGLHVALTAPDSFPDRERASTPSGQRLVALSNLCVQRSDCTGFLLGFSNGSDGEIAAAAAEVAAMLL